MTDPSSNLLTQDAQRRDAINNILGLRRQARAEIDRLLEFLDATDDYVRTELEIDNDADLEDDGCGEPSLGSGTAIDQGRWALKGKGVCDAELEHDGREPDRSDYEPTLGWTVDGFVGPTLAALDEAELTNE